MVNDASVTHFGLFYVEIPTNQASIATTCKIQKNMKKNLEKCTSSHQLAQWSCFYLEYEWREGRQLSERTFDLDGRNKDVCGGSKDANGEREDAD